jgi:Resolvase, N terminal domain
VQVLAPGDTLVVWRLDRLGRSMAHLVTLIEALLKRQVGLRSLCDGAIDTTTASGALVFHLFSALAQFERRLIADGLIRDDDSAGEQQLFHIPVAQAEAEVEPDAMADDLSGKPMMFLGGGRWVAPQRTVVSAPSFNQALVCM